VLLRVKLEAKAQAAYLSTIFLPTVEREDWK
jgi:hypothetical protein